MYKDHITLADYEVKDVSALGMLRHVVHTGQALVFMAGHSVAECIWLMAVLLPDAEYPAGHGPRAVLQLKL